MGASAKSRRDHIAKVVCGEGRYWLHDRHINRKAKNSKPKGKKHR